MRHALPILALSIAACAGDPQADPASRVAAADSASGTFTDDQGNVWTLTSDGRVQENGRDVPGGGGTSAITYIDGTVYAQDAASGNWYAWQNNQWAGPQALPQQPPPPSAPTVLTTSSGGSLTDAQGNVWTLTAGGTIQENGGDVAGGAGTSALTYANGTIYGEDARSGQWYTWTNGNWDGPVASPVSNPSPNNPPPNNPPPNNPPPSGNPPPPSGDPSPTTWQLASASGMQYMVLLPAGYSTANQYPVLLYLHQLDEGSYGPDLLQNQINAWFNTSAFRSAHAVIVVAPLLDQSSDYSGVTINYGGVSTDDNIGETNAIAVLNQALQSYSTDRSRVYVTGNSLGGIGSWDMIIKFNAYTGTEQHIFAAAMPLAGADYGQGFPNPNANVIQALRNVPIWAIHGSQDGQVPLDWDRNMFAAQQAQGGAMKYTEDPNLGHDVWDTYYPQMQLWNWLFSQQH